MRILGIVFEEEHLLGILGTTIGHLYKSSHLEQSPDYPPPHHLFSSGFPQTQVNSWDLAKIAQENYFIHSFTQGKVESLEG